MPVTKSTVKKPAKKAARVKKVTFEDFLATLDRIEKERAKDRKETEKALREAHEQTEKVIKETQKQVDRTAKAVEETQKRVDKTTEAIGKLGNRLGDMAEHLLTPNLTEQFKKYGFNFGRMGSNVSMKDKVNGIYAEIDAMLENGTQAMAVEVKVNLKTTDVDDHIERMEKIRKYADLHGDNRQFYGAVAGTVINEEVELYAIRHGFYVIKPSGEDITIVPPVSQKIFW
ncbi:hypothetical protein AGMMS49546_02910 [Spirochaetia bacterium]|nr:hypothetical protein AGMMS49546_02910 [Spirochaetia bacterium]